MSEFESEAPVAEEMLAVGKTSNFLELCASIGLFLKRYDRTRYDKSYY